MAEYKLLRPLPNKVVGQKVREDDLKSILNMNTHHLQALVEGGWIEEWVDPKSKVTHINTRNYVYGNSKISIKVENTDKSEVDFILNNIEKTVKSNGIGIVYLTRLDLAR